VDQSVNEFYLSDQIVFIVVLLIMENPVSIVENPVSLVENPVNPMVNPFKGTENPVNPVENPVIRMEQVYELPGGWVKKIIPRKGGASGASGQWDAYLYAPDNTKIRSNQDLIKYLAATGLQIDPFVVNMDKSCVKDKAGGKSKPSKGVMHLRDAIRKMSSGEHAVPSDNSFRGFKDPNAPAVPVPVTTPSSSASEYFSEAEVTEKSFSKKKLVAKKLTSRVIDLTREDCPLFIDLNTKIVEAVIVDEDNMPVDIEGGSWKAEGCDSKFESLDHETECQEVYEGEEVNPMDYDVDALDHVDVHIQETADDDPLKEFDTDIENYEHEIEHADGEVFEIKKEVKKGKAKKRSTEEPFYKGCEYLCKICNETRDSTEHIRNHVKKYHPELEHNDPSNYDMIKEEYFDCPICDENMLRDYLVIKKHVRCRHKMGMVEFANEHVNRS